MNRDGRKTEWRCDDSELDPSDHWSFGQIRPINGHQRTGSTIVAVLLSMTSHQQIEHTSEKERLKGLYEEDESLIMTCVTYIFDRDISKPKCL